jgi:serine/threonine-protein kinase
MCPNCSHDNPDDAKKCAVCPATLRGLLGADTVLHDRFKVISVLGFGAMGAVYLAQDELLVGRRCAVKENRPDDDENPDVLARIKEQFLEEAHVLARLDHPVLPKVSDYFIENDWEYLVMDYVEGEDLESRLQRAQAPLPEDSVLSLADQVLDALTYLHNQEPKPIIHRDIKPANLRVNVQGRIKLVDFGLVKLLDSENPETKIELRGLGTPAYAPLEQFAGSEEHTDARADVYALGATMYQLLTNQVPVDVHQRLLHPPFLRPLRELNPQLSEQTEEVVLRAMAIHPDDRFQSADQMRQALLPAAQPVVAPVAQAPTPAPLPPHRSAVSRSLWVFGLLGLLIVLIVLGGVALSLFRNPDQTTPLVQVPTLTAAPAERSESTPTEFSVQALADAPTLVPTMVVTPTVPGADLLQEAGNAVGQATSTPTVETTSEPTSVATSPPRLAPASNITKASLVGTIAYPVFNGTDYDIYFGQADGSGTRLFRSGASQPAFSLDGSRIAFRSWRPDSRGVIVADASGANLISLTNFFEDQLPTWSPDGSEIILHTRRSGDRRSELIKVNSSEPLGQGFLLNQGEYPSIGQSGQLVFKGWEATGKGLRLAGLNLEGLEPVTDLNEDTAPALSPDGQKIAFMSRRDEDWEIYVINADGSGLERLTESPAQDGLPTWSPDGKAIAFVSDRGGTWAVWVMTPAGKDQQQLFAMEGSPDGFVGADTFASRGWAEERISWTR